MNKLYVPKNPALKPGEDYYLLRRDGVGFIEKMASSLWTDYNTHDPGITILEALCYAITDLAYRAWWDIRDILTPEKITSTSQPYPYQPFFTARDILTINPTTPNDFRRVLIDLAAVRDAWVFCRECGCEADYYAWCDNNELKKAYLKPPEPPSTSVLVSPQGLYDVLLELESDRELGDLNNYRVDYYAVFTDEEGNNHAVILEFRFPKADIEATQITDPVSIVEFQRLNYSKSDKKDILTRSDKTDEERSEDLQRHWHDVFYLDFVVQGEKPPLNLENVAMRIFSDSNVKKDGVRFFKKLFIPEVGKTSDNTINRTIVKNIYEKKKKRHQSVSDAKEKLQEKRNLNEDFCLVQIVDVEEVAACADVQVKPEADIELVMARILLEIENYFNPPVPYHTLKELMDSGTSVEEIFNGPGLANGFIKTKDLENASLKSVLYVSDILNKLMDIDGVIAVNHFQLTKFDDEGEIVAGAADPQLIGGKLTFDKSRTSADWSLHLQKQHQPRFYQRGSRFIFYKNGLPFYPTMDEVNETLTQLKGESERPKITDNKDISSDLPVPLGTFRNPEDYYPVQYSFPLTYGIGQDGLPPNATDKRRGQAAQLKAYLMVFEQLLANACSQVAHTAELFSLNVDSEQTYFAKILSKAIIQDYHRIVDEALDEKTLTGLVESRLEFHKRRNRFLDHIMARFGEEFNEYALLLTNLESQSVALDDLIEDKIAFLKAYPQISANRAHAFNYTRTAPIMYVPPETNFKMNQPGIKARVSRLTGSPDFAFAWIQVTDLGIDKYRLKFQISDQGKIVFAGNITLNAKNQEAAKIRGYRAVVARMSRYENFHIVHPSGKYQLRLKGKAHEAHGESPEFGAEGDAASLRGELITWAAGERVIVVEHLLLRPKFPGDALLSSCCCDEDPYSFRLTFITPGWNEPFMSNMDVRGFVDRTIMQETPSHLLAKICWVNKDHMDEFEGAWYIWLEVNSTFDWAAERLPEDLEIVLKNNLLPGISPGSAGGDVCGCAKDILARYGKRFHEWMRGYVESGGNLKNIEDKFDAWMSGSTASGKSPEEVPLPDMSLCPKKFVDAVSGQISEFLSVRYKSYLVVSYRLWKLVVSLSNLNNIYPAATLHDWAEGDDKNPARLGKTALGSNGGARP